MLEYCIESNVKEKVELENLIKRKIDTCSILTGVAQPHDSRYLFHCRENNFLVSHFFPEDFKNKGKESNKTWRNTIGIT